MRYETRDTETDEQVNTRHSFIPKSFGKKTHWHSPISATHEAIPPHTKGSQPISGSQEGGGGGGGGEVEGGGGAGEERRRREGGGKKGEVEQIGIASFQLNSHVLLEGEGIASGVPRAEIDRNHQGKQRS